MKNEAPSEQFVRIVSEHQTGVWRYLSFLGCDAAQADDLTQETFLAFMRISFDDKTFQQTHRYLRTIAYRLFLEAKGKLRRELNGLNIEQIDAAWSKGRDHDAGEERIAALRVCMDELEDREREAVRLHYMQGAKRIDAGAAIGLSDGGVKNLLSRVKERLKRCVEGRLRA